MNLGILVSYYEAVWSLLDQNTPTKKQETTADVHNARSKDNYGYRLQYTCVASGGVRKYNKSLCRLRKQLGSFNNLACCLLSEWLYQHPILRPLVVDVQKEMTMRAAQQNSKYFETCVLEHALDLVQVV
jgi:hypothetical protein